MEASDKKTIMESSAIEADDIHRCFRDPDHGKTFLVIFGPISDFQAEIDQGEIHRCS
jgi:hypothetical protein